MTDQAQKKNIALELSELNIGYDPELPLVRSVNASVDYGELVALVGKNGSGKSTLIKTAAGLLRSLNGKLCANNEIVEEMSLSDRARLIGYVAAGTVDTANLNVYELVALGRLPHTNWVGNLSDRDKYIIEEVLSEMDLKGFENRKVFNLSDGEKQRTMIARALAQDTPILLLDEPTAFLDLPNKYVLFGILERLRKNGKTILFSTHDIETASLRVDKLWVIHKRTLIEGSPEDLGLDGVYNEMFYERGVVFNNLNHRFENPVAEAGTVRFIQEEGDIHLWTSRALTRAGLRQTNDKNEKTEIVISENNRQITWSVLQENKVNNFHSLYELIKYLIRS